MKTILKELFYVPKHAKVSDKTMLTKVIISVIIIICCLATMSLSAYAFFSYEVTSVSNVIKSAKYNISITVYDSFNEQIEVISDGLFAYKVSLDANKEYTVKIKAYGTAQTGFCIVTASGCENIYHTRQLGVTQNERFDEILFTVKPTAETQFNIQAHWGTSVYYGYSEDNGLYIQNAEFIELPIISQNDVQADSVTDTVVQQSVDNIYSQASAQSIPTESSVVEEQLEEQNTFSADDIFSQKENTTASTG